MTDTTCLWKRNSICIFDISQPGEMVTCLAAGCGEYESPLEAGTYRQKRRQEAAMGSKLRLNVQVEEMPK